MPPLTPEEFGPGRQITRGGDTLDVLGNVSSNEGGQFVIVTHQETQGMALLIPAALLRDDESEFTAVDEEERQAKRQQAEEDRQQAEAKDRADFEAYQQQQRQAARDNADNANPGATSTA